jgi:choline dehydrogenase
MIREADYIVVGSGAGGGPLAANLARKGYEVLLIEAGGDLCETDAGRLMYEVPVFHGLCTEDKTCSWDFYVHHYSDPAQAARDTKFVKDKGGVWYPRAGTLGGCTAHNAMITVTPQAIDWDDIARLTGDWTWTARNMAKYFARLETCGYVPRPGSILYLIKGILWSIIALVRRDPDWRDWRHGHGFEGWLHTAEADPLMLLKDRVLTRLVLNAVKAVVQRRVGSLFGRAISKFDPNDLRNAEDSPEGLAFTPLAVHKGRRNGPREFVRKVEKETGRLHIALHTLVTRVLFDGTHAIGVEALEGKHLYGADPNHDRATPKPAPVTLKARKEVIVAAGAFNTPQLLKLSGVGPRAELERFGIPVVSDLPGVGENLQDRYEVAVVSEFPHSFELLQKATFEPPKPGVADPFIEEWRQGRGLYTTNGSVIGVMKRSQPGLPEPDLYIFGLAGDFRGYVPGYSQTLERYHDKFTWVTLKAYTNNRAGAVTLTGTDPTQPPRIDFHSFLEGTDEGQGDLEALVNGVGFIREMNKRLGDPKEIVPKERGDTPEKLRQFIRDEAWGHHASCSAKIGHASDPMSVLDSRFRVRGVSGLRVVDASVFPRIPGYFIVSAVYMISEKAADVILADAERPPHRPMPPAQMR